MPISLQSPSIGLFPHFMTANQITIHIPLRTVPQHMYNHTHYVKMQSSSYKRFPHIFKLFSANVFFLYLRDRMQWNDVLCFIPISQQRVYGIYTNLRIIVLEKGLYSFQKWLIQIFNMSNIFKYVLEAWILKSVVLLVMNLYVIWKKYARKGNEFFYNLSLFILYVTNYTVCYLISLYQHINLSNRIAFLNPHLLNHHLLSKTAWKSSQLISVKRLEKS